MSVFGSNEPVIITCALTGGIHGKEANPNLPEQPDEIVEQGVEAWRAGAAIRAARATVRRDGRRSTAHHRREPHASG